jgi:hypothetical protein
MAKVSKLQIYDLAVEIWRDIGELQVSIHELLIEMRSHNRDMLSLRQRLAEASKACLT